VIASIAVPSYRGYMRRAQRADATAALLQLRQAQEKFFLQNGQYATGAQLTIAPPGGLGLSATSEHGHYTVVVNRPTPTTFTATATATGGQASDGPCQTFTINEAGVRGSGPSAITTCWK
jgi:type IV pilus assembly protein PilE